MEKGKTFAIMFLRVDDLNDHTLQYFIYEDTPFNFLINQNSRVYFQDMTISFDIIYNV